VADLSVNADARQLNVARFDCEFLLKEVTVAAPVRLPGGETVRKTLVITLQRAILSSAGARQVVGGWIVTGFREAGAMPARGGRTSREESSAPRPRSG
jgi:hypothetical protein